MYGNTNPASNIPGALQMVRTLLFVTMMSMMQENITAFRTPVYYYYPNNAYEMPSSNQNACTLRRDLICYAKQRSDAYSTGKQPRSNASNDGSEEEQTVIETIAGGPATLFQDILRNRNMMFWRPHKAAKQFQGSIPEKKNFFDNSNTEFRYKSPAMTQEGYALTMLKNSRKRNKPVLWRYTLKKYKEMNMQKLNVHHEAALVACAKLGLYREALEILFEITRQAKEEKSNGLKRTVWMNEGMLSSVVKACVRASRKIDANDRRRILNYAKSIVLKSERSYGIKISSHLVNPLVARYQRLGYYDETPELLDTLSERVGKSDELNINNFSAKDSASYGLIVREAVVTENWSDAIQALKNMTDHGVYPVERQMNSWNEAAYKNERGRSIDIII